MKILCDPVLTAHPSKCSTLVQFITFMKRVLETRPDVFFYCCVPDSVDDEGMTAYPQDARIRYLKMPRSRDRVRDYIQTSREFEDAIAFNGDFWDFDVLLTVRAGLIPLMKIAMNSPRTNKRFWTKQVWLIEDMPMVSFKETVPNMVPEVHDRWTLEGHLAADKMWICSYHEKAGILREARNHFTPSLVRQLDAKIKNVVTGQFEEYALKDPSKFFKTDGDQPFGLAYIGRMEKANNIEEINDAMINSWITRGDKIKPIVCTVSEVLKTFDEDIVDCRKPGREEFWRICKEEMHAFIKMPKGGGFSLSLIEPIMFGTPVIALRSEMYESLLGKHYPFFANGPSQIPGLIKALYDDYEGMYARFAEWHEVWFEPTYRKRFDEDNLYEHLLTAIDDYEAMLQLRQSDLVSLGDNEVVKLLAKHMENGEKTIFQSLAELGVEDDVGVQLTRQLEPGFRHGWGITFSTPWHPFKLGLTLFHGYEDASTEVGHLRKRVL
jgi:hypothetical protein